MAPRLTLAQQASQPVAPAQAGQSDQMQMLQALLDEVRQLRLALQRNNLTAYRAQILLERLRAQQERVDRLTRELEALRNELVESKTHQAQMTEMLKGIENRLNQETDQARRNELEMEQRLIKTQLEQQAQRDERQREREAQLMAQLQIEQAKLEEINSRLDALENELEKQGATERPGN
jgi:chromosome segregation ATPase